MAHHFSLIQLNPFILTMDREGWSFEHPVSLLQVLLPPHNVKIVSWPWLFYLREWGYSTLAFAGKFLNMAHHFILLRLNVFVLRVDRQGGWFEQSVSDFSVCLPREGA